MKATSERLILFLSMILIFAVGSDLSAEVKFTYDRQVRLRSELDLKSTDSARHTQNFNDLRTRVGLKFEPTDLAFVYVQLQDSRRLGGRGSGDLNALNNVDLHQAFFVINNAIFENLQVKAGRFELNYGNQRVFGSVGWHNVGRSWEGGILGYRNDILHTELFYLKKLEMDDKAYNRDFDIVGLYGKIPDAGLDLFAFYEIDADDSGYVQEKLRRFNLGGFYEKNYDKFDFCAQAAVQFGEMPRDTLPDSTIQDISAFMIASEIGYTFDTSIRPRIGIGIDYTSGDDGADSTKFTSYTNAYYTGHKFRGFMDQFTGSPRHGLIDILLRLKADADRNWQIKGDLHYFLAADYYVSRSDSTVKTTAIGYELDLTVVNKSIKGATVTGGSSFFLADDHYSPAGSDKKIGIWAYLMTTINF